METSWELKEKKKHCGFKRETSEVGRIFMKHVAFHLAARTISGRCWCFSFHMIPGKPTTLCFFFFNCNPREKQKDYQILMINRASMLGQSTHPFTHPFILLNYDIPDTVQVLGRQ